MPDMGDSEESKDTFNIKHDRVMYGSDSNLGISDSYREQSDSQILQTGSENEDESLLNADSDAVDVAKSVSFCGSLIPQSVYNQQLAKEQKKLEEEYKYVENLRRNCKIAETRFKALQQAISSQSEASRVAQGAKSRSLIAHMQAQEASSHGDEGTYHSRKRSEKFAIESPPQKIKEEGSLQVPQTKISQASKPSHKKSVASEC